MDFKTGRDFGMFTDKRILLVDIKGFNSVRKSVFTLKYTSISSCELELDVYTFDSVINITTDSGYKVFLRFRKPIPLDDMFEVYHLLNNHLLVNTN